MRWLLMPIAALGLMGAGTPANQPMSQQERTYTITLICAVLASENMVDADVQRSMDAVRRMGAVMGYSSERIASDLITMTNVVADQMRYEPAKVQQSRAVCRQLGLTT